MGITSRTCTKFSNLFAMNEMNIPKLITIQKIKQEKNKNWQINLIGHLLKQLGTLHKNKGRTFMDYNYGNLSSYEAVFDALYGFEFVVALCIECYI